MTRAGWVACCVALVAMEGVVGADDQRKAPPKAQAHVEAGVAAYGSGDYDAASRAFEAAYAIDPDPKWLYAWAQARRLGDHCDDAVPLYRRYLETEPGPDNVAAARTGIALCEPRADTTAKPPPPIVEPPASAPPNVPASPVIHNAEGSPWYADRLGSGLMIGGVVTAGVGTSFLVLARRRDDEARAAEFHDDFLRLLDEASLRRRIGYVCVGVGAALAIGGVVRYVTRGRDSRTRVTLATSGDAIWVWGTF